MHPFLRRSPWLLCTAFGLLLSPASHAEGLRLGAAAGSADYGTALKLQLNGAGPALRWAPLPWRWEAQLTSFGRERYSQFGNSYQRSAWALGAAVLPQFGITSTVTAYGKLGLHHLHSEASGPGLDTASNKLRLGFGVGLRWQALPRLGLRVEAENIGGSGGDLLTIGAEVPI
jgi:hypothetical protein